MKKEVLVLLLFLLFLTACSSKNKYEDNPNTPFIEIPKGDQNRVEKAFLTEDIIRSRTMDSYYFAISARKDTKVSFQENYHVTNSIDYHYWLTCYYSSDETIIFQVERTDKGYEGNTASYYGNGYNICGYKFSIWGVNWENFTYILVYKDGKLYELDYAYENKIINDEVIKKTYKSYLDSKFLKFDPYYDPYTPKKEEENE